MSFICDVLKTPCKGKPIKVIFKVRPVKYVDTIVIINSREPDRVVESYGTEPEVELKVSPEGLNKLQQRHPTLPLVSKEFKVVHKTITQKRVLLEDEDD